MHAHSPILGFKCMVAPNYETARQGDPKFFDKTISWDVQQLLGRVHALFTLAPSLSHCIRKGLEAKQVSPEAQDTYLKGLKRSKDMMLHLSCFMGSASARISKPWRLHCKQLLACCLSSTRPCPHTHGLCTLACC